MTSGQSGNRRTILVISRAARLNAQIKSLAERLPLRAMLAGPDNFQRAISSGHEFDIVILDINGVSPELMNAVDSYVTERGLIPILFVVDEDRLGELKMPSQGKADFIVSGAGERELAMRLSLLAWPDEQSSSSDIVSIDNMTINLATYQVTIDDKPVDLTLMEYSLLSFLATHPSRAYSRETLLHRVWGFEYCGGTRTVDVHIRRVRSKVGPQVASHITTVRGVGYLFKL